MTRRVLALVLLAAGFWLLTQGVANAGHCGEVNYDAGQQLSATDCGPVGRGLMKGVTLFVLGATALAGAVGVGVATVAPGVKMTVTAATGAVAGPPAGAAPAPAVGNPQPLRPPPTHIPPAPGLEGAPGLASDRDRSRSREKSDTLELGSSAGPRSRGRTGTRNSSEDRTYLGDWSSGNKDLWGRHSHRIEGIDGLGNRFVKPNVRATDAVTSTSSPPPARPDGSIWANPPAADPVGLTLLGTGMTLVIVGKVAWDVGSPAVRAVVRWIGRWWK